MKKMLFIFILYINIFLISTSLYGEDANDSKKTLYSQNYLNVREKISNYSLEFTQSNDKSEKSSFWKKTKYTIGYSGGICWTGPYLSRAEDFPIPDPTITFYWVNSIEASIIYSLNDKIKKIEVGGGYVWWPLLTKRSGLGELRIYDKDSVIGYVSTGGNWRLFGAEIFSKINIRTFFVGISLYLGKAFTVESLHFYTNGYPSYTTAYVQRWWIGWSIFYIWKEKEDKSTISPYIKLQIGSAKEYRNNSPWEWKRKLSFGLSGVFVGIKFKRLW
jgi:hypothetical protein